MFGGVILKKKGILFILLAGVGFASMTLFSRLSGDLPTMQKAFFRNLFATFIASITLIKNKQDFKYEKSSIPFLLIRSICGTMGIVCNFYAIDHLVLSDANILNKLSPFAAVIFSIIFLKERASLTQFLTLLGAFMGAVLIIQPSLSFHEFAPGMIGLTGGIMAGAAYTAVRYLGQKQVNGMKIVFFFSAFSCIVIFPFVITQFKPMAPMQWLFLTLCGISATIGQICITKAYTYAPAKEISIYDYFQILVSAVYGFLIFQQKPNNLSILGYLLIFAMSFINWSKSNKKENV